MKKVLIVFYSQSGQLERIAKTIAGPLDENKDIEVDYMNVQPENSYPFPWSFYRFFDAFPESVYLDPPQMKPFELNEKDNYDLIIIAYTVWYLSPAPPIVGFLKSEQGRRILSGKPVITVIGCRNMWIMAQEKLKKLIFETGARLLDNVVLVDQGSSLATFVTTPRWMLTGKKDKLWGIFPPAGVSDDEINNSVRFGRALVDALKENKEKGTSPLLTGLRAVIVNPRLITSEKAAHRSFLIWGKLIRKMGKPGDKKRIPILAIYVTFLITFILTVVPITMVLKIILQPFMKKFNKTIVHKYELPSGSGSERMN